MAPSNENVVPKKATSRLRKMFGEIKFTCIYIWFFTGLSIGQWTLGLIVHAYITSSHWNFVKWKHTGTEPFKCLCWMWRPHAQTLESPTPMSKAQVQCKKPMPHVQSPSPRGLASTTIVDTKKIWGKLFFSFRHFFTKTYMVNKGDKP